MFILHGEREGQGSHKFPTTMQTSSVQRTLSWGPTDLIFLFCLILDIIIFSSHSNIFSLFIFPYIYIYTYIHTYIHTYTYIYIHTYIYICMYIYIYIYIHTYISFFFWSHFVLRSNSLYYINYEFCLSKLLIFCLLTVRKVVVWFRYDQGI